MTQAPYRTALEVRNLGQLDGSQVGLWVGNTSGGDFANLVVTPAPYASQERRMNEFQLVDLVDRHRDILHKITASHVQRYLRLQRDLPKVNVAEDDDYQRCFNGFYRIQRKPPDWYAFFFRLLQREKSNAALSFGRVLETLHREHGHVEPSFSSKLVATVNPDMPVYDRFVRENLELKVPTRSLSAVERIAGFENLHHELQERMGALVRRAEFRTLRAAFDEKFPGAVDITDIKVLDFFLWQYRRLEPSADGVR